MSTRPIQVVIDASPLVDPPTGVGRFTQRMITGLLQHDDIEVRTTAVSARGLSDVRGRIDAAVDFDPIALPARPVRRIWTLLDHPRIDRWIGDHDVLHANFAVPPSRGVPVSTVHDLTPLRFPDLRGPFTDTWMAIVRRAIARGGWIHTVSDFVREEVLEHFQIEPERVRTVANGFDRTRGGDPVRGRELAGSDRFVIFVGTIEPRKGLVDLLGAFDALAADDSDLRLVLVGGDGWNIEPFEAALDRTMHRERIVRTGYVDDRSRQDLLAAATVMAYPSRYEGFGLPPLEAMDAGVPVVAAKAGAVPEVVGDAAVLVEVGDVDGLTGALEEVLRDEGRAAELVRRGRIRAESFSWQRSADGIADLYRAVVAAGS